MKYKIKRPDLEPNKQFSKQLRQALISNQRQKRKRFSLPAMLTLAVTFATLAFLVLVITGQSLERKQVAKVLYGEGNLFGNVMLIVAMLGLLLFIVLVYYKGLTKGKLVYMTFSLSLIAWLGNIIYAEQYKEEQIEQPATIKDQQESTLLKGQTYKEGEQ